MGGNNARLLKSLELLVLDKVTRTYCLLCTIETSPNSMQVAGDRCVLAQRSSAVSQDQGQPRWFVPPLHMLLQAQG